MRERNKIVIIVFKNPLKLHNLSILNKLIKIHYMVYKIIHSILIIDKILKLNFLYKIMRFVIIWHKHHKIHQLHKIHKRYKIHKLHKIYKIHKFQIKMRINHKIKTNKILCKLIKSKNNRVLILKNRK